MAKARRKVKNNHHLYIGRAGHLASMVECLSRGWNVAIPEVDVGEDIFVVEDATSTLVKVQVKSAIGKQTRKGFTAQFIVSINQLNDTGTKGADIRFVFVVRFKGRWHPFLIIKRDELLQKHTIEKAGSITPNNNLKFTFYYSFDATTEAISKIECGTIKGVSKSDFTGFIDKWEKFFTIRITEGN